MQSKLIRKYFKCGSNYQSVEEGWGFIGSILLLGPLGGLGYSLMHWSNINKVMGNDKIKKYIKGEADKLFAKYKKKYKSLTPKCQSGLMAMFKKNSALLKNSSIMERLKNPGGGQYTVDKYTVLPFGDTDHVERIEVVFYIEDEDKYIAFPIPAPSKADLIALGLRKEEN